MLRLLEDGVKELRGRRSDITGDRAAGAPTAVHSLASAASPECSHQRPTGHHGTGQPIQAGGLRDWIASHDYEHDFVHRKLGQPVKILGEP